MDWARLLAYITGAVGQELLLRNETRHHHGLAPEVGSL
jgi:hypothetical protein